jgi:putative endonuclease
MFYVYAIQSIVNSRVYVGQTDDIDTRLADHNAGRVLSTRQHRPWRIIKLSLCESREAARLLEYQLKGSRGKRLKWLKS